MSSRPRAQPASIRALIFDVFGTVVDWRGSIIRECTALGRRRRLAADWPAFTDAWRAGYRPAMARVRSGELPWMTIDQLHRTILDELLPRFEIEGLTEDEIDHLNRVWHRLEPWPDARRGLALLKRRRVVATLSNGNMALLVNMAKHARLPWDCVLSAELFHHYKPDPESYLGAAAMLGFEPAEVMMVAAHKDDLRAAQACGLATAFVRRAREKGPKVKLDLTPDPAFDCNARDFVDLARRMAR
ncbi:MAG: haloacid dehalogenase, type II [Betaproteobacteria bacterium RBG_16_66_20]|nr:MAG: haloacid dehalogenase, type II [Betaproteobacteria bacterium RBG_16_66_20]